jgi:hypothetical protein
MGFVPGADLHVKEAMTKRESKMSKKRVLRRLLLGKKHPGFFSEACPHAMRPAAICPKKAEQLTVACPFCSSLAPFFAPFFCVPLLFLPLHSLHPQKRLKGGRS